MLQHYKDIPIGTEFTFVEFEKFAGIRFRKLSETEYERVEDMKESPEPGVIRYVARAGDRYWIHSPSFLYVEEARISVPKQEYLHLLSVAWRLIHALEMLNLQPLKDALDNLESKV